MRKYFLALFFCLVAGPAWAQCNGVFGPNQLCGTGASSGIPTAQLPPIPVPTGGTGVLSFTANLPLIGNGSGAIAQGTRSGSTTVFATTTGTLTNGHCVQFDGSGNLIDAGGACTVGGGGGTVSAASQYNIGYYATAGTVISGNTTITTDASNHLISPTLAGGSATSSTLTLESTTGAGATDLIKFQTGSQVEAARIDTNQRLTIGGFSNTSLEGNQILLETAQPMAGGVTGSPWDFASIEWGTTAGGGPSWAMARSRGTSPTVLVAVNSADLLGSLFFYGATDTTHYREAATIQSFADANFSGGSSPGRLEFLTTPSGTVGPVEAMRIDSSQRLIVNSSGTQNPASQAARLEVVYNANSDWDASFAHAQANASGIEIAFAKTRGASVTTQTALQSGDEIFSLFPEGSDGAAYQTGGYISFSADANYSANSAPTLLRFATTPSGSTSPAERMRIDSSGKVGIGATAIKAPFEVRNTTQNIIAISGTNGSATRTIAVDTSGADINTNIGAAINFVDDGAFGAYTQISSHTGSSGTTQTATANFFTNGLAQEKVFRFEADLNMWGTLSCNHGSPSSSGVAQAVVNAYNAGWRNFLIPDGCFIYTGDTPWVSTFGSNTIPNTVSFRGEDYNTSGMSVCSTYTGCTPGAGTLFQGNAKRLENVFQMDGACYNVDSSVFGHPARCPVWRAYTNSGFVGNGGNPYPENAIIINMGPVAGNGTWNGTDQPAIAENNETRGDGLFIQALTSSYSATSNFLNFFGDAGGACSSQQVGAWTNDGRAKFGSSACTSHVGSGTITIVDSSASCGIFANVGGISSSCSSDERLKSNIVDVGDQLAWLSSFRIRDFTVKADGERMTGVVAQELERSHPEMVRMGEDGFLHSLSPSQWKMLAAMQQMQAEITELQRKVH